MPGRKFPLPFPCGTGWEADDRNTRKAALLGRRFHPLIPNIMEKAPEPASGNTETEKSAQIKELNDRFRQTFVGGRVLLTTGLRALGDDAVIAIITKVRSFDDFTADNDPYGEHDFGSFSHDGEKVFWKVDCYNESLTYGSEDPSDPEKTTRVLTIMLASEY